MSSSYKPEKYNSVSPYFVVDDAQRMADLLRELFDAEELRRYDNEDGTIMHLEMRIDDSVVMIANSTARYPPNTHLMHVYVRDVNDTFRKALRLGCTALDEPKQKEGDPDRRGMFSDFAGNTWAIGTQLDQ